MFRNCLTAVGAGHGSRRNSCHENSLRLFNIFNTRAYSQHQPNPAPAGQWSPRQVPTKRAAAMSG